MMPEEEEAMRISSIASLSRSPLITRRDKHEMLSFEVLYEPLHANRREPEEVHSDSPVNPLLCGPDDGRLILFGVAR
jgi:hypothetical protein